jgi:hypothetical protein
LNITNSRFADVWAVPRLMRTHPFRWLHYLIVMPGRFLPVLLSAFSAEVTDSNSGHLRIGQPRRPDHPTAYARHTNDERKRLTWVIRRCLAYFKTPDRKTGDKIAGATRGKGSAAGTHGLERMIVAASWPAD